MSLQTVNPQSVFHLPGQPQESSEQHPSSQSVNEVYFGTQLDTIRDRTDQVSVPLTAEERAEADYLLSDNHMQREPSPTQTVAEMAYSTADYNWVRSMHDVPEKDVNARFGNMVETPREAAAYGAAEANLYDSERYLTHLSESDEQRQARFNAEAMAVESATYQRSVSKEVNETMTPKQISDISKAVVAWRLDALGKQDEKTINTLRIK